MQNPDHVYVACELLILTEKETKRMAAYSTPTHHMLPRYILSLFNNNVLTGMQLEDPVHTISQMYSYTNLILYALLTTVRCTQNK